MRRFLIDNGHKAVVTADYAVAMEKTCHCDLDWFFDQWAYGIGYPKVKFQRHWAPDLKTLHVVVSQAQTIDSLHPLYRFPATIRVVTRDSVVRQNIMVTHQTDTFAIALPSAPLSFRLDEGGWLLGTVSGDYTVPELAEMAKHDLDFAGRNWALHQLARSTDPAAADAWRFMVLNEHEPVLRTMALIQLRGNRDTATLTVVKSALRDPEPDVRAQALRALASVDSAAGLTTATAMYANDPSTPVRQTALPIIGKVRGADALPLLIAATGPDQPPAIRLTAAQGLGASRDPRAADALERMIDPKEDRGVRTTGLFALAQTGDSARASAVALRAVGDYDPLFAVTAVDVAARMGGASARAALTADLKKETRVTVRLAITRALAGH